MSIRKYVRQVRPIQEKYIRPADKIQMLSDAYDILPKSEKDIDGLKISPSIDKKQLKKLFTVIRKKSGDIVDPIALDPKKKEVKVFRSVAAELDLPALSKEFGIDLVNIEVGIAPFIFSIDQFASQQYNEIFTNLSVGNYTLEVIDSLGCETNIDIYIDHICSRSLNPKY